MDPPPPPAPPILLGTSSVPYSPLSCSPSSLVPNTDGQYAIVTRGEINIFTPALGYSTNAPVTGTSAPPPPAAGGAGGGGVGGKTGVGARVGEGGKGKEKAREELPLLRTIIPVEKKNVVKWHEWVDEYDVLVSGANDAWWRSATWSPSGLSPLGGCIIATLTNDAEVLLFAPNKDAAKGEWHEICDFTSPLIAATIPEVTHKHPEQTPHLRRLAVASIRRCQTSSLAWSPSVSSTAKDYSLLALGHRSGEVSLWRLGDHNTPTLVHRFRPAGEVNWINVLEWSSWSVKTSSADDTTKTASSTLALADSDGRVWSVEVSQTLSSHQARAGQAEVELEVKDPLLVVEADKRGATQLCWIERKEGGAGSRQLAFSKLGTVSIATLSPSSASSDGTGSSASSGWRLDGPVHEVELRTEGAEEWMGANAWAGCSGLAYIHKTNSLLVSLSSSSLHSITLPSPTSPSQTLSYDPTLSSLLTHRARLLFSSTTSRSRQRKERFASEASGKVTRKEGGKGLGFVSCARGGGGKGGLDVAYVYETERPSAFTHRTAAGTRTYFTIANLAGGESTMAEFLEELDELCQGGADARTETPLLRLQSLLLHLRNASSSPSFVESLLSHLQQQTTEPIQQPDLVPPRKGEGTGERLVRRLFGAEAGAEGLGLEAVRVRETVARALTKEKDLPQELHHAALTTHITLARQLIKEVLSRIASTVGAVPLSDSEKPLHARLLLASSSLLPSSSSSGELLPPDALAQAYQQPDDLCPACKKQVPLANVRYGCCEGGHQWERCSLTLSIVSTTAVRTCSACARKALLTLPPGQGGGGEVVNEVLKAASCCVYCGGRWMRVR